MKQYLNTIGAFVIVVIAESLGGIDQPIKILGTIVVIDFLTGIAKALYLKEFSSAVGYKGVIKKVVMFMVIALAVCLDNLNSTDFLRGGSIFAFTIFEASSVFENAGVIIKMPKVLTQFFEKLKNKE